MGDKYRVVIRYALVGIFVALTGVLLVYVAGPGIGYVVIGIGVLIGFSSILVGRIMGTADALRSREEQKRVDRDLWDKKAPWE